jgi:hypothetical protein
MDLIESELPSCDTSNTAIADPRRLKLLRDSELPK